MKRRFRTDFLKTFLMLGGIVISTLGHAQVSSMTTAQIQSEINAAVAAGTPSYTLPGAIVNLTTSLVVPRTAKNFTLRGTGATVLRRNTLNRFPLIIVGYDDTGAMDNATFNDFTRTSIQPATEGTRTLTRTGGGPAVVGWYAILGIHPTNDVIKIDASPLQMTCKRELIYVSAVNGNTMTINQPLSRTFDTPELRLLEARGTPFANRVVPENIRISNITLQGRGAIDNVWTEKVLRVSRAHNVTLSSLNISGFNTAGIGLSFSKGVTIDSVSIDDGNQSTLGYGIEVFASRFVTIRKSTFKKHRWGTVFQSGSTDCLVEDCIYTGDMNGGFDASHGGGEKRITFRRVLAPIFSVANPAWLRGCNDITFENCTALRQFNFYANAENVKVKGMYPGYNYTARQMFFLTDGGRTGAIPSGVFGPKSVFLSDGALRRNTNEGTTVYFISLSGQANAVKYLETNNFVFENQTSQGVAIHLSSTNTDSTMKFNNTEFIARYPYGIPISVGPTTATGSWNIQLNNSIVRSNWTFAVYADPAAKGTITSLDSFINGNPISSNGIQSSSQMTFGVSTAGL